MDQQELSREIGERIRSYIDQGRNVSITWLVQDVMLAHEHIEGDDSDWYLLCAREHVRSTARREVQRYKPTREDRQGDFADLIAPGFHRIQKAYLVERQGEQQVVPLANLTDEDGYAKITELEQMAIGCREHAEELRTYLNARRAVG